ncbi:SHOCT domain-containing protein [Nocardioides kribbensis]|uniref:SHOCT domain-containing protein n=1 Tax=Nocardioides kribbensis TaxID=305517 RepID=UPI00187AD3DB|nr:SHOCT domain-containing protein [Nocardioides kribbensis]
MTRVWRLGAALGSVSLLLGALPRPAVAADGSGRLPDKCARMNAEGQLPTCTRSDGGWVATYPDSPFTESGGASGAAGLVAALVVLGLVAGLVAALWRVSVARRMARESGMSERDASLMALGSDDGLEATYLAASLRGSAPAGPAGPAAAVPPASDPPSVAARLRTLLDLREQGLITDEEYDARRRVVLDDL